MPVRANSAFTVVGDRTCETGCPTIVKIAVRPEMDGASFLPVLVIRSSPPGGGWSFRRGGRLPDEVTGYSDIAQITLYRTNGHVERLVKGVRRRGHPAWSGEPWLCRFRKRAIERLRATGEYEKHARESG
jgi:hypothetical protein